MKWPLPFVRRKARHRRMAAPPLQDQVESAMVRASARPVTLADMLRECDRHDDARAVEKLARDLECTPAEVLALADDTVDYLRSGDDGSPSETNRPGMEE